MIRILVIGAGRSATSLIDYLAINASEYNWKLSVADVNVELVKEKVAAYSNVEALLFNSQDTERRRELILKHDFIISMLPAFMHAEVAADCVELGRHMATASYVSDAMRGLDSEAKNKGLLLLNECGLDPGIDHASAMKIIDDIHARGGQLLSFRSYCGGLVAPESNDNPWGYKFSWNPRNVVLAGQGTAQYLENGELKFIPYNRIFQQTDEIAVDGFGRFDAYANRDSIGYIDVYGLKNIQTMVRGTLRQHGYCKAWDVFVQLGWTDDTSKISNADRYTYTQLLSSFLPKGTGSVSERLKHFLGNKADSNIMDMLEYLGLFSDTKIRMKEGTPAQLLQDLLEDKWKLKKGDKDMIVMQHQFEYSLPGTQKIHKTESSLGLIGRDDQHTAMALTVGLPLAITVKNFLSGKFKLYGVQMPVKKEIYTPLLSELESHSIVFTETHS